jgi:hypothetical protein
METPMNTNTRPNAPELAGRKQAISRGRVLMSGARGNSSQSGEARDPFKPSPDELMLINRLTLRDHSADELWVVPILACDNQPTKHDERLLIPALEQLAPTFIGRPGLEDHYWSATVQNCRIFDARVATNATERSEVANEAYTYLALKAYTLRTADNATFRANVEGGILKETSVGFFLDWLKVECSICGGALYDWGAWWDEDEGACPHIGGREYDGQVCLGLIPAHDGLEGAENSWVAVPAAPRAGAQRTAGVPAVGMAQFDAEGDALRRDFLARKERTMQAKELLGLLTNPTRLQEALAGEDQAVVAPLMALLAGSVRTQGAPECCCHAADKDKDCCCAKGECDKAGTGCDCKDAGGDEGDEQAALQAPATAAAATTPAAPTELQTAITAAVQAAVAPLQIELDAIKQSVGSKLAPVPGGPLVAGFTAAIQPAAESQTAAPQSTIGSRIAGALLAE